MGTWFTQWVRVDSVTGYDTKRVFYCASYSFYWQQNQKQKNTTWLTTFTKSEGESIYHCTVYPHAYWQTARSPTYTSETAVLSWNQCLYIDINMKDLHFSDFCMHSLLIAELTYQNVKLDSWLTCGQSPSAKTQLMWVSNRPMWQVCLGLEFDTDGLNLATSPEINQAWELLGTWKPSNKRANSYLACE